MGQCWAIGATGARLAQLASIMRMDSATDSIAAPMRAEPMKVRDFSPTLRA